MFSVEIKINGSMIHHIHGVNKGSVDCPVEYGGIPLSVSDECIYECQIYDVENNRLESITLTHSRADGIGVLIAKILGSCTVK